MNLSKTTLQYYLAAVLLRSFPFQGSLTVSAQANIPIGAEAGIPIGAAPELFEAAGKWNEECHLHSTDSNACAALNLGDDYRFVEDPDILLDAGLDADIEEEDPMLQEMPGYDGFKAYKRADISSFYQEAPGSREEQKPKFRGQAGKFVNMTPKRLDLHWDAGKGAPGTHICPTGPFESCGTATFPDHVFYFLDPSTLEVVCSFRMIAGTSVYYCDPFSTSNKDAPSTGIYSGPKESFWNLTPQQKEWYKAASFNREFAEDYKNFTGGSEWLTNYPSQPPQHFMWRADYFGQKHFVETAETHFTHLPTEDLLGTLSFAEMSRQHLDDHNGTLMNNYLVDYREPGTMNLTLEVVSVAPRIIQIDNFLSETEVEHLLQLAHEKNMKRSTTGRGGHDSHVTSVRTSQNAWLKRNMSPIMDSIIRRGADVLKIDEALMRSRSAQELPDFPGKQSISEDLQIVHYDAGQQYTAHHDFSYPDTRPNAPSRSINLCMYLNEGMVGGETAFPRWRNADTDEAIKAVPKKGKAMIFYMRTPDGNLDDLSQHAAMPVVEGEKWFANLWTWDPVRG